MRSSMAPSLNSEGKLGAQHKSRHGSPAALHLFTGRLLQPATAEPPPATRSTAQQPGPSESTTSLWSSPLTRDRRGRQSVRSGSRAALPPVRLRPARPFSSAYLDSSRKGLRDRCGPGHLARSLTPRGRRLPSSVVNDPSVIRLAPVRIRALSARKLCGRRIGRTARTAVVSPASRRSFALGP